MAVLTEARGTECAADAPAPSVRDRILDQAQALFAEHGYAATATRAIAQGAGVNLAQLHYYFGAKRDLFKAAYLRGAARVTEARSRALEQARAEYPDGDIPLERLVRAFVEPFLLNTATPEGRATMAMHARLHTEPEDIGREVLAQVKEESKEVFFEASLFDMINALSSALSKVQTKKQYEVKAEEYTVEGKIHSILHLLLERPSVSLLEMFQSASSKKEMIVTFVAILELIRLKEIVAVQRRQFEDIEIMRNAANEQPPQATQAGAVLEQAPQQGADTTVDNDHAQG